MKEKFFDFDFTKLTREGWNLVSMIALFVTGDPDWKFQLGNLLRTVKEGS